MGRGKSKTPVTPVAWIVSKLSAVVFLALHVLATYLFVDGVAMYYGKTMDFGYSIEIIFDVMDMKDFVYRGVGGAGLGILYLIIFCILIKNIMLAFKCCKDIFLKRHASLEDLEILSFRIGERLVSGCVCIGIFVLICHWLKAGMLPMNAKLVIAIGIVGFVLLRVFDSIISGFTPISIAIQAAYSVIFVAIVALLIFYSKGSVVSETIDGFKMVSTHVEDKKIINDVLSLVKPIFYGIITVKTLILIDRATSDETIQNEYTRESAKGIVRTVAIFLIFVFVVYMMNDGKVEADKIYNLAKPYLSLILAALSLYFFAFSPSNISRMSSDSKKSNFGKVDAEGVLRIKDGVSKIPAYAYCDRRDLVVVVIPKSVLHIGEGAFSGCGALEEIHCRVGGKPSGWDEDWDKGFYGTVHWKSDL